jgi:hypothetical protein
MPGFLPATGSQISFGRVNQAYTNNVPGSAGSAPSGGQNISLSSVLGSNPTYGVGQTTGTQISFAATFGGRFYPFTY